MKTKSRSVRNRSRLVPAMIVAAGSLLFAGASMSDSRIKDADLAGSWYVASPARLSAELKGYLEAARPKEVDGDIIAIIAPHAGLGFSGPIAAYSYRAAQKEDVRTVIIVGFSHRKRANGIAIYAEGAFRTPLGEIEIDADIARQIKSQSDRFIDEPRIFEDENSVEMQIPFVQAAFKGAKIVPIAFGEQSEADGDVLAKALSAVLRGKKGYLIVASTDLAHNVSYDAARSIDKVTVGIFERGKVSDIISGVKKGRCEMCGSLPVYSVLSAAEMLGYDRVQLLKYANSGDIAGGKDWFVGYLGAVVYRASGAGKAGDPQPASATTADEPFNARQRKRLIEIARGSIEKYLLDGERAKFRETDPALTKVCGAFVTLRKSGELRGCIGSIVGRKPLYETVSEMAIAASVEDPRFPPLTKRELATVDIEISVLSPLRKVSSYRDIVIPGNGVVVKRGYASGVYLPQVAEETGWGREEFLSSLCSHKAGLPADAWKDPATELYVFDSYIIKEGS